MKALEILKQLLFEEKEKMKGYEHLSNEIPFIQEAAIAELEALQYNYEAQEIVMADLKQELQDCKEAYELLFKSQNKSCDGCRYDSDRRFGCYRWEDCNREHTRKNRVDRYEPEDK